MELYHFPLPSLDVRSINFVSTRSINVEYLGVDTGRTAETAMETAVVMPPVRDLRNDASTASGIVGAIAPSLLSVLAAASSGAFLFAHPAIVQSLYSTKLEHEYDKLMFYVSGCERTPRCIIVC